MVDEVPSVQDLRWPALVVLDAVGDDLHDLEERVAQHLWLSDAAKNAIDPDTDRRLFQQRLEQALEDLYRVDAIEPDDDGRSLHITDVGKRFSEPQARELLESTPSETDPAPTEEKPSVMSWITTILDSIPPH